MPPAAGLTRAPAPRSCALYISKVLELGFEEQDESYLKAARTLLASLPAWRRFWDLEVASGFWPPGLVAELAKGDVGSLEGIESASGGNALQR